MIHLLFPILYSLLAFANDCDLKDLSNMKAFQTCLEGVSKASRGPSFRDCVISPSGDEKCDTRYQKLLSDGTINITIAGGYGDYEGTVQDQVWDEQQYHRFVEALTSSCPAMVGVNLEGKAGKDSLSNSCGQATLSKACNFKRTDDPEIFVKTMTIRDRKVQVQVRLLNSSLTSSDRKNRKSTQEFIAQRVKKTDLPLEKLVEFCRPEDRFKYQICKSHYVKKAWASSIIQGDEVVMYAGHARNSGGPSFDPPKVLPNGHVDYDWFKAKREGHVQETEALALASKNGKPPLFYANLSCDSTKHFLKNGNLRKASPSTAFNLSNRVTGISESFVSGMAMMNGIFKGKCEIEMDQEIQKASCGFGLHH